MMLGRDVAALRRAGGSWHAIDASGADIADAPVVILANAGGATGLVDLESSRLQRVAGQLTFFAAPASAPHAVVCGRGYILPDIDGYVVAGASFDPAGATIDVDDGGHAANLRRAERLLPGITAEVDMAALQGQVGVRSVARDRLPMVGAVVDMRRVREIAPTLSGAHGSDMPHLPGLYCAIAFASRGLAWTALAAECLASQIEGEPLPLETALVDAIDPGRFAVKRARKGALD
jgi:tRNA 5-methylaminomethyl-2-thiouridine biosynthesis bifunctional protein